MRVCGQRIKARDKFNSRYFKQNHIVEFTRQNFTLCFVLVATKQSTVRYVVKQITYTKYWVINTIQHEHFLPAVINLSSVRWHGW